MSNEHPSSNGLTQFRELVETCIVYADDIQIISPRRCIVIKPSDLVTLFDRRPHEPPAPSSKQEIDVLKIMRDMQHVAERGGFNVTMSGQNCKDVADEIENLRHELEQHYQESGTVAKSRYEAACAELTRRESRIMELERAAHEPPASKEQVTLRHIAVIANKTEFAAEDRIEIIQKLLAGRAADEPKAPTEVLAAADRLSNEISLYDDDRESYRSFTRDLRTLITHARAAQPPSGDQDGDRFRWLLALDDDAFLQIGGQSFEMHELAAHIDAMRAPTKTAATDEDPEPVGLALELIRTGLTATQYADAKAALERGPDEKNAHCAHGISVHEGCDRCRCPHENWQTGIGNLPDVCMDCGETRPHGANVRITVETDASPAPWMCVCGQLNSDWANECGRCERRPPSEGASHARNG